MNRKIWPMAVCAILLMAACACTKHSAAPQVIVEIPSGFSGNFLLEMGVKEAPPLEKRGEAYVVPVPKKREAHHVHSADGFSADVSEFQRRRGVGLFALASLKPGTEFRLAARSNFLLEPEKSTRRNRARRTTPKEFQLRLS